MSARDRGEAVDGLRALAAARPAARVTGPRDTRSDSDTPVRETLPGSGRAVELRVYRFSGALRFDWWYDTRRIERATAQPFPVALAELTRNASESPPADHEADGAVSALTLVDLSATDTG